MNKKTPKKKFQKITASYLRNSGLFYLQKYTASSSHFKTVMRRKIMRSCQYHKEQNIEECIELLEKLTLDFIEEGHLDDSSYLKAMVNSLRNRGSATNVITLKLKAKGFSKDTVLKAIENYDEEHHNAHTNSEMICAAITARKKKIGVYNRKFQQEQYDKDELYRKDLARLARAGFSFDIAKDIMKASLEELEELSRLQ